MAVLTGVVASSDVDTGPLFYVMTVAGSTMSNGTRPEQLRLSFTLCSTSSSWSLSCSSFSMMVPRRLFSFSYSNFMSRSFLELANSDLLHGLIATFPSAIVWRCLSSCSVKICICFWSSASFCVFSAISNCDDSSFFRFLF